MAPTPADRPLRFGRFEISAAERVVRVDGQPAALGARAFDLLLALAERRDRLVDRQELLDLVWPGVVVEEHNIAAQISSLRKLLGPGAIATVPGRGYRFTAVVDAAPTSASESGAAAPQPRHHLPEPRTRFIGREAALADLARLLPQTRLLTLTGIGGSGKTRLALEFARRQQGFADGAWFVDLAPLNDPERVASACAAALQLDRSGDAPPLQRVAQHLAEREALIVLDNCEQVRDGAAALVDTVLARPGRTKIIATSREALAVAGEQHYPVRSLGLPAATSVASVGDAEAARVFVDRARLAQPDFELDAGNAAAVAEICRRLDGIALAIELAAARVPMLPVHEIAARLHDRFRLLTGGRAAVARQQTLQATMRWSYDQLAPDEQRMLRLLAVCAGGWTLATAAALAHTADEYEALALLTALHDKSLIAVDRNAGSQPRYRMLETVREYAQQRLAEDSAQADAARRSHAEHFLALAREAAPHLSGRQQSEWMARLGAEQENLLAALAWCCDEHSPADPQWGLQLAAATGRYWLFNEVELGCRLLLAALRRDRVGADGAVRYDVLRALSGLFMHRGRRDEGLPHAQAALAMAQRMQDTRREALGHVAIGTCQALQDEDAALRHYEQACNLARAGGHAEPLAPALNNSAGIYFRRGQLEAAELRLQEAVHLSRGRGDVRGALINLHNLIRVQVAARKHVEAHDSAAEAGRLLEDIAEPALKFEWIEVSAGLASILGEHDLAARLWGYAGQLIIEAGYQRPPEDEAHMQRGLAASRHALGDAEFERAQAAGRALDLDAAMLELTQWLRRRA